MQKNNCAVVLLGPPGSGKTTLVRLLAAGHRFSVIETGNLLKQEVRLKTPLGLQMKPYTDSGDLVPSEWVREVIRAHLETVRDGLVLFDGFPRRGDQIEPLFQMLKSQQLDLCGVIILNLDLETAVNRLGGRRICSTCGRLCHVQFQPPKQAGKCDQCGGVLTQRSDDKAEVIAERFKSYELETMPVIEFFRREFKHLCWEGTTAESVEQVAVRIGPRLEQLNRPSMARAK